jgi:hypothetical protein
MFTARFARGTEDTEKTPMLHKQHDKRISKAIIAIACGLYCAMAWSPLWVIQKTRKNSHVVYPSGKPMIQHLLRCQGFGVNDYSLTHGALHLRHPRLLQR